MSTFSISASVSAEIQRIFLDSKCRDPVARLYERADARRLFDDFAADLVRKGKTEDDLRAKAAERLEKVGGQLESSLMVSPGERADFQSGDLCEVGGVTFVMNAGAAELLRDCCLSFENGSFLLRGGDNRTYTLRSLSDALKARNRQ
jgi:hypothetical protein